MLVMSRKVGEVIMVGDDIQIVVVSIDRGHVRIGVQAPRHVPVDREELYVSKKKSRDMEAQKYGPGDNKAVG
jgi:carbon storage regulator